jgi:hypothetical protein
MIIRLLWEKPEANQMLKIVRMAGADMNAPLLFCDICDTRIENAKEAALVFKLVTDASPNAEPLMVHKGECLDAAEARLGGMVGWQPLLKELIYMLHNVGVPLEMLKRLDHEGMDPQDDI